MSWTSSTHSAPPRVPTPYSPYSSSHEPSTPYPWDTSSPSSSMRTLTSSIDDVESTYTPPATAVLADTSYPGSYVYTGSPISSLSYPYWSNGTYVNNNGTLVNDTNTNVTTPDQGDGDAGAADAAASASALADDGSGPSASLGLKVGMAVGTTILILGLILGITCLRRHRRRKERYTARDMRERGREDGMGHFDVLESPVDATGASMSDGPTSHSSERILRSDTLIPPVRPFDARFIPSDARGQGYNRASSVGGSSSARGSSAWEDDSEADAMANDGSTLARTLSTDSRGSVGSDGTIRGSRDSVSAGSAGGVGMDHPGYTYMSRRPLGPLSALGHGSDRDPASPFSDPLVPRSATATSSSAGHPASTPTTSLYPPLASASLVGNPFASTEHLARQVSTSRPPRSEAHTVQRIRDQHRLSTASTVSAASAGSAQTANTAGTGFTATTRTTLPEYTYISTGPDFPLSAPLSTPLDPSLSESSSSPFDDANPFDDPSLPTYEGTLSRVPGMIDTSGRTLQNVRGVAPGVGRGMIQRDGPPAYSM